jgi:type IV pilus assembly protein PilW
MTRLRGFTLSELLIAMLLTLFLMTIALTAFSGLSRSVRQTQQLSELQQNAQFLMSLMQNELGNTAFWGGLTSFEQLAMAISPAAPEPDCLHDSIDSGSFPQPGIEFISLYAQKITAGRQLNCIPTAIADSELLQLKRLIGRQTSVAELRQNRFYLETSWQHGRFVDVASAGLSDDHYYFPYQHVVFYLQSQRTDNSSLPVLMRKRLTRNAAGRATISTDAVLDGVERMHFEFGFDSDLDGRLDYQLATARVPLALWQDKGSRIVSLTYHVLLRSRLADPEYQNDNEYQLGDERFVAPGDHYRRMLISSTLFFHNATL